MIKGAITILVLGFAVVFGAYYFGGIRTWDPDTKGREAKAALAPGMTWSAAITAAGEPGRYQYVREEKQKDIFGNEVVVHVPGLKRAYDYAEVSAAVANNEFEHGFIFYYIFTQQVAFRVWFDSNGVLESIEDVATMANLLDTRKP